MRSSKGVKPKGPKNSCFSGRAPWWGAATFRYTFTEPCLYRYVCLLHESQGMIGSVLVEPVA